MFKKLYSLFNLVSFNELQYSQVVLNTSDLMMQLDILKHITLRFL